MNPLEITFLGTGDAFGHGGRLQPCILVRTSTTSFLLDCGASAMISFRRFKVDPNSVGLILLSHLHGDHFGGLPFFILDAQFHSKRTEPLVVAGPKGTLTRLVQAMELLFPGSTQAQRMFALEVVELDPGEIWSREGVQVLPYEVVHPSGDPALALRVSCEGKIVSYTGDTEWTENLIPASKEADLLIAECYFFEKRIKYHLNYRTLRARQGELESKRIILTHLGQEMLDHLDSVELECARDGMTIPC